MKSCSIAQMDWAESFNGQISHLFSKISGTRHENNIGPSISFLGPRLPEITSLNMCQSLSLHYSLKIMLQISELIIYWFILYHIFLWYFSYENHYLHSSSLFFSSPSERGRGRKRGRENEKEQRKDKRKIGR